MPTKAARAKYGDYKNDERICLACGKKFKTHKWRPQKYCSLNCGLEPRRGITFVTKICLQCSKQFQSEPWRHQKFCSFECGIEFNRGKPKKRRSNSNPGFRIRHRPERRRLKNGKRIALHRYIMEQHLKRSLNESETVHHIDCDSYNNEIDNLFLFSNESEHIKGHHSLEPLVKFLISKEIIIFRNGRYHLVAEESSLD